MFTSVQAQFPAQVRQGTLTLFKGEVSVWLTSLYLPVRTRLF